MLKLKTKSKLKLRLFQVPQAIAFERGLGFVVFDPQNHS
jgi:hypothetical protein